MLILGRNLSRCCLLRFIRYSMQFLMKLCPLHCLQAVRAAENFEAPQSSPISEDACITAKPQPPFLTVPTWIICDSVELVFK